MAVDDFTFCIEEVFTTAGQQKDAPGSYVRVAALGDSHLLTAEQAYQLAAHLIRLSGLADVPRRNEFKACLECGHWFAVSTGPQGSRKSRKFCSDTCRVQAHRKRTEWLEVAPINERDHP